MNKILDLIAKVRVWGVAGILSFIKRELNTRVHRRKLLKLHRASQTRNPKRGITIVGDLTCRPALSKTLRDFVLSLKDIGIPVQTYDTSWERQIPDKDICDLITPENEFDIHRYTNFVIMYRSPLTKEITAGHRVARIVFHDSAHGINSTMPYLKESGDEIIAMSDFNYEYFLKAFPTQKVWKIAYPFRFKLNNATPREELRRKYGIKADDFVVFFNFDFGSYYRKNIPASLEAFALAFKGEENAKLIFKTKAANENKNQLAEMEAKVKELGIESQFIHIATYLPRADLDGLTGASDVYLSLHKSEGFGLGMAEAMSQAKPVVATNWSANTEFCHPDTAWCVHYKMVPILPHEYPPSMIEWAQADIREAANMLREISLDKESAKRRALEGKKFIENYYSLDHFKRDVDSFLSDRKDDVI